jgi:hypothetical protein
MCIELDLLALPVPVKILGVNAAGYEAGNGAVTRGRKLPWLQDTDDQDVWGRWGVTWRDVWILDTENEIIDVHNLTRHDLGDPGNYADFKRILEDAARRA